MAGGESQRGSLNPAALIAGVATLLGVLSTITLTGTVGRVFRNHPDQLQEALAILVIGAAFFAAAGLPFSHGAGERMFSIAGLALTLFGLLIGLKAGAGSAAEVERPEIAAHLGEDDLAIKGTVKVGNLSSKARLQLRVEGLRSGQHGAAGADAIFHRAVVGPDGDGKVDLPIDVGVPTGLYDKVRLRAWTTASEGNEPLRCTDPSTSEKVGTGCIVLSLAPVARSPQLTVQWRGQGQNERRLRIAVAADNAPSLSYARCDPTTDCAVTDRSSARTAIRVAGKRTGGKPTLLYRALLRPDGRGDLDEVLLVPVRRRLGRICVDAFFMVDRDSLPERKCPATVAKPGHVTVQLRPVGGRKRGS